MYLIDFILLLNEDRKSTRLNSSHTIISYAVFCLKKNHTAAPGLTPLLPESRAANPTHARRGPLDRERRDGEEPPAGRGWAVEVEFFFFLNDPAPPEIPPLPRPAPLRS